MKDCLPPRRSTLGLWIFLQSNRASVLSLLARWGGVGLGLWALTPAAGAAVAIEVVSPTAPAAFAAKEIASALRAKGEETTTSSELSQTGPRVILAANDDQSALRHFLVEGGEKLGALRNEGFSIRRTSQNDRQIIWIFGCGAGGVMYGGLELAEQISLHGLHQVVPLDRNPYLALRGTKFNLPLDVRTPSYTDASDAGQANIAEVWNFEFWKEYLDRLARDRYNFVSLWNMHPFPSLVKVPDYPDAALSDVQRSTGHWRENYATTASNIVSPEILQRVETLKKLTIDEKIAFWRRVMRYAKDRNIEFYIVTWNIYTYGTLAKYGITDSIDNPVTADYYRKSVKQLLLTYPLLAGVGVTMGENMGEASFAAKESWAFSTYGEAMLEVAKTQPDRRFRFIHRQHEASAQAIAAAFQPLIHQPNIDFVFGFKYAQAHALSSTTQTFHRDFVKTLGPLKTLWTIRNDDALMFRWGAPDFVREFIKNLPEDVSAGFYYGSDMWIWGREFLSLEPEAPRQLEIAKHWYHWLLWGRLGYDPSLSDEQLTALLADHFPGVPAKTLFDAWQDASLIYPLTTGFHWADYDFQWYIEGCRSRPGPAQTASGFHDVNRFITEGTHPGTDNITIPHYVEAVLKHKTIKGTTPLAVAQQLETRADAALDGVKKIDPAQNRELQQTLQDIRAMALLGKYYSHKIRGATELEFFRRSADTTHQQSAIEQLTQAATIWNEYTALAAILYKNPLWTNRVGYIDWKQLNNEVARDITIARVPLPATDATKIR